MPGGFVLSVLLYFLFKPVKLWRAEELPESDVQPITDFLHSRDFGAFAFFTQNTIYGRFVQATSHGPVSYTHLDVYKRQVHPFVYYWQEELRREQPGYGSTAHQ